MQLNKTNIIKIIPYFVYILIIFILFQVRLELDKSSSYITSDGAIKLYQSAQYQKNGFLSLTCLYPGQEFDPEFKHFPISYPWAIFNTKEKCVLEYPPFFYWLGGFLLKFLPLGTLLYLPLLFYSFNILFLDFLFRKIGLFSVFRVFLVLLGFISFSLLTALDYTENPAFQTFYLLGFYFFWKLNQNKNQKLNVLIITGALFGLAFVLRLEILMTFGFLGFIYFLFTREFKNSFFIALGFLLISLLFVTYNIYVSGHPLGFRYVSSIDFNDNAKADIWKRLTFLRASIWGNEIMVGIFKFQPLCWIMLLLPIWALFKKVKSQIGSIFLVAGWISLIVIPLYVTVYGGVGYFGLRYLEAPFFLILIGFAIYLSNDYFSNSKKIKWILVLLLIVAAYGNWLSTKEGLKILRNSSKENSLFQSFLKKSDRWIIHSSLYTSIWMGQSFLEKTHVTLTGNEETLLYLKNIPEKENFIFILSPKDIYISSDIPKKLHYRYLTPLDLEQFPVQTIDELTLGGVKLVLAQKKTPTK